MDPQELFAPPRAIELAQGLVRNGLRERIEASALDLDTLPGLQAQALRERLGEPAESLREPEARRHGHGGHHGEGLEASLAQRLRHRPLLLREHAAVGRDAVLPGMQTREHAGVRRLRAGGGGKGPVEAPPTRGARQRRRHQRGAARAAGEAVVAERVDRDEHDAHRARLGAARLRGASGSQRQRQPARSEPVSSVYFQF